MQLRLAVVSAVTAFLHTIRQYCETEAMADADMETATANEAMSETSSGLSGLPVLFDGVPDKRCKCCGESSSSVSPFADADPEDRYGGRRPWYRYKRAQDPSFKEANGSLCLICWQVFLWSGLALLHGTMSKYLASLRGKPEAHVSFQKAITIYLKKVDASKDGSVAMLKKLARESYKESVGEESRQGQRRIVRRTFVLKEVFVQLYQDTTLANRFGELDTNVVVQKGMPTKDGYWTRGEFNLHLDGHHLFEDYEDDSVVLRREHDSGDFLLAATQVRDKHSALTSVHRAEMAKSQAKLRKLTPEDMLAMLGPLHAAPAVDTSADEPDEDVPADSDDEECQDESTDFRALTLMGGAKPKKEGASSSVGSAGVAAKAGPGAGVGGGVSRPIASAGAANVPAEQGLHATRRGARAAINDAALASLLHHHSVT